MMAALSPKKRQRVRPKYSHNETIAAYLFLLPSLIGFIVFYALPAVRGLLISFTDLNTIAIGQEVNNVGLDNYRRTLGLNDTLPFLKSDFGNALKVTTQYVLWNIPIQTTLAILIAVLMDRLTKSTIVRGIILIPWLMPNVIVAMLWLWLLDPSLGLIATILENIGLESFLQNSEWIEFKSFGFLGNPNQAIPTIAGINIWRHVGYTALLIFAGIQTIPQSLYEAAAIDGASETASFRHITLPLLRPVLAFVLVTTVIGSFQIFDTIAVTTEGGPIASTKVINFLIFEYAFERLNMGLATAVSVLLFLILIVVSLVQLRLLRADEADV